MGKELYKKDYGSFVGTQKGYGGFRNKLRGNLLCELVAPAEEEKILEIGCNFGNLLQHLNKKSGHVIGIDIDKGAVRKLKKEGFDVRVMSATKLDFTDGYFDKVCAFEVIEHIHDLETAFHEVQRVLKPDGLFIVSFPWELVRGQTAVLDAVSVYRNIFYARKLHVHKLSPRKLRKFFNENHFKIISAQIKLLPFPTFVVTLKRQ